MSKIRTAYVLLDAIMGSEVVQPGVGPPIRFRGIYVAILTEDECGKNCEVGSMNGPDLDQQLLQIVSGAAPGTIADVMGVMQKIDQLLPDNDGLKWFNLLYLMVTQKVDGQPSGAWKDAAWLPGLG